MPARTTKRAANVSAENQPTIDEDEGGLTLDTPDDTEEGETLEERRACLQKHLAEVRERNEIRRLEKQIEYEEALANEDFVSEFPLRTRSTEESDDFTDIEPPKAPFYHGKSLGECKMWLASMKQQFRLRKSLRKAPDEI